MEHRTVEHTHRKLGGRVVTHPGQNSCETVGDKVTRMEEEKKEDEKVYVGLDFSTQQVRLSFNFHHFCRFFCTFLTFPLLTA